MNKEKIIDILAKWIFIADSRWEIEDALDDTGQDFDDDEVNEIASNMWLKHLRALSEEPWSDGKHCGDCTNVPMSCFRCIVDEYYKKAEEEFRLHILNDENILDYGRSGSRQNN